VWSAISPENSGTGRATTSKRQGLVDDQSATGAADEQGERTGTYLAAISPRHIRQFVNRV
jgi:hypothetical protein